MLSFKRRSHGQGVIGIDFGNHSIKALALSGTPQNYRLAAMASVPTPGGSILEHQLQDIPQVVGALKQLRRLLGCRYTRVATAVTGSSVTTKIIAVPNTLTSDVLALHIEQEATQHIPFPLDEISLDFEVIGPSARYPERNKVLLSAARTDNINARVDALQQAGWQTRVVDIGSHALARAVSTFLTTQPHPALARSQQATPHLLAVVDIGARSLTFMVMAGHEVIHTRLQHLAGEEASAKADHADGVPQIVGYIQSNLQLFCSSSGHPAPALLCVCGGGSLLPGLTAALTQALSLAVVQPDFSAVFGGAPGDYPDAAVYGTALGLALRRFSSCPT
ncbi:type IV pilus biogenesis protein PilM [Oceanisphaera sp.]|uniref:type IV pilus biogenesis protein PilM n=1 Tax=Oceanisphaera sp. TaxID=1929979 RepID=UPI003A9121F2